MVCEFARPLARGSGGGKESNLGRHCHRESKDEFNKEGGSHRRWIVAHLLREITIRNFSNLLTGPTKLTMWIQSNPASR